MKKTKLFTTVSAMAILGAVAISPQAMAMDEVTDLQDTVSVEATEASETLMKEVNDETVELENTSEVEQTASEDVGSDDAIDAENEEAVNEEDHSSALDQWWHDISEYIEDITS